MDFYISIQLKLNSKEQAPPAIFFIFIIEYLSNINLIFF